MNSRPTKYTFSHDAMGTTFGMTFVCEDSKYATQLAAECIRELDRLECELSRFIEGSDVFQINLLTPGQPLRLGIAAFDCLKISQDICRETNGAFDPTFLSSVDEKSPLNPPLLRVANRLILDEESHSVIVLVEGTTVDLGGVGKGYALDRLAELFPDWEIENAILHSGQSTVLAVGKETQSTGWKVELRNPLISEKSYGTVCLSDMSLSGSGVSGKPTHIIDPRTGTSVDEENLASWALAPSAALSDALSTALMVMSSREIEDYCNRHPDIAGAKLIETDMGTEIMRYGNWETLDK